MRGGTMPCDTPKKGVKGMNSNRIMDAIDQAITKGKIMNFWVERIRRTSFEETTKQELLEALCRLETATNKVNEAIQVLRKQIEITE